MYARPWTERWLLDQAFESVAGGDPIQRTMDLLVEVAGADTMEADAAIVFDRGDEAVQQVIACTTLPSELRGPTGGLEPSLSATWTQLLAPQEPFILNLDDLPPALRSGAESLGYGSLWASPSDFDSADAPPSGPSHGGASSTSTPTRRAPG